MFSFFRWFDPNYNKYGEQWLNAICPILAAHQVTTKPKGCVLAFQVENEAFETFMGFPMGLSDDMRLLAKAVRNNDINVIYLNLGTALYQRRLGRGLFCGP
jgi:hypothetical protein